MRELYLHGTEYCPCCISEDEDEDGEPEDDGITSSQQDPLRVKSQNQNWLQKCQR